MKNKKVIAERDAKSHSPQKNSWLALRAAREKTARMGGNFRSSANLVRMKGLEPSRLAAYAPKAYVYTNFTTSAHVLGGVIPPLLIIIQELL